MRPAREYQALVVVRPVCLPDTLAAPETAKPTLPPRAARSLPKTRRSAMAQRSASHGPGRRHLEDPERPFGKIGLSSCTVCHDPKNSPKFDYYSYVSRVNHQASR